MFGVLLSVDSVTLDASENFFFFSTCEARKTV